MLTFHRGLAVPKASAEAVMADIRARGLHIEATETELPRCAWWLELLCPRSKSTSRLR